MGCGGINSNSKEQKADGLNWQENIQALAKFQRVEIKSVESDTVMHAISEPEDIETFNMQLPLDKWEYEAALPENAKGKIHLFFLRKIRQSIL